MSSPELESMYQDIIIEAAKARHGFRPGVRSEGDSASSVATTVMSADHCAYSHQYNPTCGDELTVRVGLTSDGSRVENVTWEGQGCSISMASASLLHDLAEGRTVDEMHEMIGQFRDVMRSRGTKELDVDLFDDATALSGTARFIARVKCAMLAWVATEDALARIEAEQERA